MSGLDIEPWEPEETIGKLWHSFASRLDAPAALHEDARVTLDEVAGRVAVLFRGDLAAAIRRADAFARHNQR